MNELVVLDLETSGVNPNKHSVLEIGICPISDKIPSFHAYVKTPNIIWSDYARKNFSNFAEKWEKQAIPPAAAIEALDNYLKENFKHKATLIGHNIGFDISFLKKLAYEAELDEIPRISHRAIDTHTLLYALHLQNKIPSNALTSDGAFSYFEIEVPTKDRHTALGDAIATKELFKKISEKLGMTITQ